MARHLVALQALFETASLGSPDKAVGFVLWRVMHRYQREIDRALLPLSLTHLQFTTLAMTAWLAKADGSAAQLTVADASGIQPMQLSHMFKALEAKALVERVRDPSDIRSKLVAPTPAGIEALREAFPVVIQIQKAIFGDLGDSLLSTLLSIEAGEN